MKKKPILPVLGRGVLGALLGGALLPDLARAGAWVQEPGTAYLRVSSGFLSTHERFDENGDRVRWDTSGGGFRDSRYRDLQLFGYAEIGVTPGWNVILIGGWTRLEARQPSAVFRTHGFTDFTLGVKRALWTPVGGATSIEAAVTVPTGYDPDDYPALGSDVTDFAFTGQAGASTGRLWGNVELEYRLRGGVFRDQVRGAIGGGWSARPRVGVRGELRGGLAVGSESAATSGLRFDPATVDPNNLDLAGTLSVAVHKGFALEGEVRTALAGRNTLAGARWSLAVATDPAWAWRR